MSSIIHKRSSSPARQEERVPANHSRASAQSAQKAPKLTTDALYKWTCSAKTDGERADRASVWSALQPHLEKKLFSSTLKVKNVVLVHGKGKLHFSSQSMFHLAELQELPAELAEIEGHVHLRDLHALKSVPFRHVKGNLRIFNCLSLKEIPPLHVDGDLSVVNCPSLTMVSKNVHVGGKYAEFTNCPSLTELPDSASEWPPVYEKSFSKGAAKQLDKDGRVFKLGGSGITPQAMESIIKNARYKITLDYELPRLPPSSPPVHEDLT